MSIIREIEKILQVDFDHVMGELVIKNCYLLDDNNNVIGVTICNNALVERNLPELVDCLKKLQLLDILHLRKSGIRDIKPLEGLSHISKLYLTNNQISDISPLSKLNQLKALSLGGNSIVDISQLAELSQLKVLSLNYNPITNITPLHQLKHLRNLFMSSTPIMDITPLEKLSNLEKLNLSHAKVETIPQSLIKQFQNISINEYSPLDGLYLHQTPLNDPPYDIVKQGKSAILRYYERKKIERMSAVQEAKLIVVGEGNSGKTSLVKRLQNPEESLPDGFKFTRGIDVSQWEFEDNFTTHIWDFGGQDIYYPVHRFFITNHSVFVLLASTRTSNDEAFKYWLPIIHQFGGSSPIVVVQTCHDGHTEQWQAFNELLKSNDFNIVKNGNMNFYQIDLPSDNKGLLEVKSEIIHQIKKLPHISKSILESWVIVRGELEKMQKMCITYDAFEEICKKFKCKSFNTSSDYSDCCLFLHNTGFLFWYNDNYVLKKWIVLNPNMIVSAVYKTIDDEVIKKRNGHIAADDFNRLWTDAYYNMDHFVIKEILKEFRVAFPKQRDKEGFILPALLPLLDKENTWDGSAKIEFEFSFMPKAIVNQLSAEMSASISMSPNGFEEVWRNAVNLKYGNTERCQVIEDSSTQKITIMSRGGNVQPLTALIVDSLKNIISAYRDVEYTLYIPCICDECKNAVMHISRYNYDDLLRYSEKGNKDVHCNESREYVPLDDLLFSAGIPKTNSETERGNSVKKINVFLASSKELNVERVAFEIMIGRMNKQLYDEGIFIHLDIWEDFVDTMSSTRKQDEYNEAVKCSDIFVCLYFKKVGIYTKEEFEVAHLQFKETGRPLIYTYSKKSNIDIDELTTEDFNSRNDFIEGLKKLEHFPTSFKDDVELCSSFEKQFSKLKRKLII